MDTGTKRVRGIGFLMIAFFMVLVGCDQSSLTADSDALSYSEEERAYAQQNSEVIPGQYIVVFEDRIRNVPEHARAFVDQHEGELLFTYQHALRGFAAKLSEQAAEALERNPNVSYVELDREVRTVTSVQEDATWGLDRVDHRALNLTGTYTYDATGNGVNVYVLDTGIRYDHQDFGNRAEFGFDAFDDGQDGEDCNGHGTHVAGTVGGAEWGVAKEASLWSVRVLDCGGSGTMSGVIAGVDWVTENHADHNGPGVANMSLGGGASSALDDAVRNSVDSGLQYSVAAGNGNRGGVGQSACDYSPARVREAMTISATNNTDTKPRFANHGECVDWFAPGVSITSAWHTSDTATNTISGTSMSAPHVAGAAALFLEGNTGASSSQVFDFLYAQTTKDVVNSANSANAHMLFTLWDGDGNGDDPDPDPVVASFSYSCDDLECSFSDESDGDVQSWHWDFGDGGTSSAQNPSHTYVSEGSYTVTLEVTGDGDDNRDSTSETIEVTYSDTEPGDSDPEIDEFSVSSRTTGPWLRADASWSVSDEDGDLVSVTSELLGNGSVVDSQTSSVSGTSASGEHELRTRNSADAVRLTVIDASGNEVSETRELN